MWPRKMRAMVTSAFLASCLPLTSVMADDACAIRTSQPVLDFGTFNSGQLKSNTRARMLSMGKRYLQLSVICPDPTKMALTFQGQATGSTAFNMSNLGAFTLNFKDARVDGKQVLLGRVSSVENLPASIRSNMRLLPHSYIAPISSGRLVAGKVLNITVEIEALAKPETGKVLDKTTVEGEGQFAIISSTPHAAQGAL